MSFFNPSIKTKELHPQLRFPGEAIRLVLPRFTKGFMKTGNFFLKSFGLPQLVRDCSFERRYIKRQDGSLLRLCIYRPKNKKEPLPGLLWIHGGGYALGTPEQDFSFIKDFLSAKDCVIICPDYICSPDKPYPAAFLDCYNSLVYLKSHAKKLGIDDSRIFLGGNSAGGGLAMAVALKARDTGDVNIAFNMPLYPMLDDRMITESSRNNDAPLWNTESNRLAWKMYLGKDYGTDKVSKYAAPARERDYTRLPPTLTYIGTVEPFLDETIQLVRNLEEAEIPVEFKTFEGCFHAFDLFSFTEPAKQAREFLKKGFSYAVENYSAKQEK